MIAEKKAANAVGAKTARACDSCLRRRARWYCAADDAFLCQACDSSVHSANQLARRHKRIRLETASSKMTMTTMAIDESSSSPSVNNQFVDNTVPAWHGGFRRKARTPRISKKILLRSQARNATSYDSDDKVLNLSLAFEDNDHDLVPEIGNEDEECPDENHDEEFHCRVPVFDPFASEVNGDDMVVLAHVGDDNGHTCDFHGSFDLPSDTDLAKFAADVENLLSNDDEEVAIEEDLGFDIKELGLLTGCKEEEGNQSQEAGLLGISSEEKGEGGTLVKVEEEEEHMVVLGGEGAECLAELGFDVVRDDSMDWDIECYNKHRMPGETDREKKIGTNVDDEEEKKTKRLLRLNYEGVMAAWPCQRCPWITGNRPEFDPNKDSWPNFSIGTTNCSSECHRPFGDLLGLRGQVGGDADGGREARVSRYREKRRTRMFSKKIRYQVRKLNAEKRPRMKGRFVKRTSSLELSLVSSRGRLN